MYLEIVALLALLITYIVYIWVMLHKEIELM